MRTRVLGLSIVALCCLICFACTGTSSSSNNGGNNNNPGAQTWIIDAGPDPVQTGREEKATVTIQPFTYSGVFDEVQPDPLGGMLVYNGDGSCHYQVTVGGSIFNGSNSTDWQISNSTGSGCGMSTVASGTLTGIGTFPTSTQAGGTITFLTQSPLGSSSLSGQWNASLQSGGSQKVMQRHLEEQLHEPRVLFDLFQGFQPLDFRH